MKISQLKKRTNRRFKYRQLAIKKRHRELVQQFNRRASIVGIDRKIGDWRIIDVHEIPEKMQENHEVDFWCCNGKALFLLRLKNRKESKFSIVPLSYHNQTPTYLIAELPIIDPQSKITDEFLYRILNEFMQMDF